MLRAREQVTRLCPSRYCPRTRVSVPLPIAARPVLRRVRRVPPSRAPASLCGGLPPIGERWGGFGESSEVDTRELVLGALDTDAWLAAIGPAAGPEAGAVPEFLRSLRPPAAGQRVLYVEHALLPHGPSRSSCRRGGEYGGRETATGIEDDGRWRASPLLVDQALQQHLLQVGYVDRLVGALLDG